MRSQGLQAGDLSRGQDQARRLISVSVHQFTQGGSPPAPRNNAAFDTDLCSPSRALAAELGQEVDETGMHKSETIQKAKDQILATFPDGRKVAALHPTGKPYPDEPSGDVAVQSDSALPGPAVSPTGPGSESDQTMDLTPGPPAGPATKRDVPAPPAAFGRYQVRNALGAGGFGAVYLGHDTQLDRPVAIKVLRGGPEVPQAEAERFLQEARRLARLSHPGIVTVHDVGLDGGQVYIVSDFLDGPDLGRWLAGQPPAWPEAARIAAAVADALAHAHARLIVHRDVKPANIILTPDRGPVLVDFGLGLDEAGAGGSELGVISGTPAYMAPEQVAGAAHRIDGRTDIYSLGVVLYEMLCGRLPFRASNTRELLRQVRDDEPQPPRQLRPEIPPELETGLPQGAREAAPGPIHHRGGLRRRPEACVPAGRRAGRLDSGSGHPPRSCRRARRSRPGPSRHRGHPRRRPPPAAAPARPSAGR